MRNEKIIEIDGKSITIKELTTAQVVELIESSGNEGIEILVGVQSGLPSDIKKLMRKTLDLSSEIFDEITETIRGFDALEKEYREVNASFFDSLTRRIGNVLLSAEVLQKQVLSLKPVVSSLKKGT